jgi:hypothetical protein
VWEKQKRDEHHVWGETKEGRTVCVRGKKGGRNIMCGRKRKREEHHVWGKEKKDGYFV